MPRPPSAGSGPFAPPTATTAAAPPADGVDGAGSAGRDGPEGNDSGSGSRAKPFIIVGAILAVVLLVGVIVAVATSGSDTVESYSLEAALDDAADASSVEYDMSLVVGDREAFAVSGAVDGSVLSLQVDLGDLIGADAIEGSTADIIVDTDDEVLYIQADELIPSTGLDFLLPDFGWLSIDFGAFSGDGDEGMDIAGALSGNPLELIDAIGADAEDATDLGSETIDGVETLHYQFSVDVGDAVMSTEQIADLLAELGLDFAIPDGTLGEVTYDVWVTDDNEVRRVAVAFAIGDEVVSMVIDVHSIDEAVDIEIPDDDEVFDLGGLLSF